MQPSRSNSHILKLAPKQPLIQQRDTEQMRAIEKLASIAISVFIYEAKPTPISGHAANKHGLDEASFLLESAMNCIENEIDVIAFEGTLEEHLEDPMACALKEAREAGPTATPRPLVITNRSKALSDSIVRNSSPSNPLNLSIFRLQTATDQVARILDPRLTKCDH